MYELINLDLEIFFKILSIEVCLSDVYLAESISAFVTKFSLKKCNSCSVTGFSWRFLENVNVNSRSPSLFAVARPSVVCLSSVTFVRPTQVVRIFGNISTALGNLPWPSIDIH